jgi:ABC-2 type transport system ATP-binding protein
MSDALPISTTGLVKRYRDIVAVNGVDLTVERGDVFGYLGPNGAGKTTLLRMLLGLIRPTAGSAKLFGRDPLVDGVRALDGVAGFVEGPRFYSYLSGRRNLELLADYDGDGARSRIDGVLEIVELRDRAKDRVGGYSHGMRQRLGIAASLLCNRVAIIRKGSIVYDGPLKELLATAATGYRLRVTDPERARVVLLSQTGVDGVSLGDGQLRFTADEDAVARAAISLGQARIGITALIPETASLEELFLGLTGGESSDHDREAVVA